METNRPNIVTVGLFGGVAIGAPLAQMMLWFYRSFFVVDGWPPVDPETAAAFGAIVTAVVAATAQARDRSVKRSMAYVRTKYADQEPGQPPP